MTDSTPEWKLKPGDSIKRKDLHDYYGGSRQSGISPCTKSKNVIIFTDPASGEQHGYRDEWMPDGCFHYTGEGKYGDQRMIKGNASILNHVKEGRALRVFQGARDKVTYKGEFILDEANPWHETDSPETDKGPLRKVFVFHLHPIDTDPLPPQGPLALLAATHEPVKKIPLEKQEVEKFFVNQNKKVYSADRTEAKLVINFSEYLHTHGRTAIRQQLLPSGESRPLFTDLYVEEINLLIEAKGSVTRENIRMAIGQLADYSRLMEKPDCAILVPSKPRPDLIDLAHSQGYTIIWQDDDSFHTSNEGISLQSSNPY
ncbi:restriction endonuclease [Nocardiopsis sp. NPDC058631]|uniref:restriction endonuclease n=1 Tax=Nocardiopsis sp. NPDC058631 TaxID=3346566 RepID=UPI00365023F9